MTEPGHLTFDALSGALKAAGEDTRLRVLVLLSEAELTVSDLTEILRQSQPRISRHLKLLVEAGLLLRSREGAWAFFRLADHGAPAPGGGAGGFSPPPPPGAPPRRWCPQFGRTPTPPIRSSHAIASVWRRS